MPASEIGPLSSVMRMSVGVQRAVDVVERGQRLARRARRTTIGPVSLARSKACSGWPSSSIRVVGHVDGERDRPHAAAGEPDLHPQRAAGLLGKGWRMRSTCKEMTAPPLTASFAGCTPLS